MVKRITPTALGTRKPVHITTAVDVEAEEVGMPVLHGSSQASSRHKSCSGGDGHAFTAKERWENKLKLIKRSMYERARLLCSSNVYRTPRPVEYSPYFSARAWSRLIRFSEELPNRSKYSDRTSARWPG